MEERDLQYRGEVGSLTRYDNMPFFEPDIIVLHCQVFKRFVIMFNRPAN